MTHNDIKPDNIMVMEGGRINFIDFGLALNVGRDGGNYYSVFGVPHHVEWCSPRQLSLEKGFEPEPRDMVYSLGLLLWFLLVEIEPYEGMEGGVVVEHRMKRGDFDLLNHPRLKEFPDELFGMIAGCLSDKTTLRELKERLERKYDGILKDRKRFCIREICFPMCNHV